MQDRGFAKGFKITDRGRSKTVGVACTSLDQLLKKAREKFHRDYEEDLVLALEDGTIVEDEEYFKTIPSQTLLILYRPYEDIVTGVDVILNALKCVNSTYLSVGAEAAQLLEEKAVELSNLLNNIDSGPLGNTPETDPEWFDSLDTCAPTKEDFMYKKAQDRLRGYLYKCQDDIRKSEEYVRNKKSREVLETCLSELKRRLIADKYFGCYFDRRFARDGDDANSQSSKKPRMITDQAEVNTEREEHAKKRPRMVSAARKPQQAITVKAGESICDAGGRFVCEGVWKASSCEFAPGHSINPYLNKPSRLLFSTWNLDHRIEKSRTIIPALLSAAKNLDNNKLRLNYDYFYSLLFTRANLGLVHIVCHDKGKHRLHCDHHRFYLPAG